MRIFLSLLTGAVAFVCVRGATPADSGPLASVVKVNRAVAQVQPPKTGLEFSANPTAQELFQTRVFEEPLVPIGGEPTAAENSALAAALLGYANRNGPDDFSSLTAFLAKHPQSPWCAALLTDLGLEYYNTAHYSLALEAWASAWSRAKNATDAKGKAIADRALGELAYMYARLGRMGDIEALLNSIDGRVIVGSATERISGVRQALWTMQNRPEVAFRCGPLALHRILLSDQRLLTSSPTNATMEIFDSASTQQGFSLPQVAELSKKVGLNYQMAFRSPSPGGEGWGEGEFVVPSVVHWKVGHYAALVRKAGDRYQLQDPTFGNEVWATREALESETSGYFLVPPGALPSGFRTVEAKEGNQIWGKGLTSGNESGPTSCSDPATADCSSCPGMAVPRVHLMPVSLNINDEPVGYAPPVGPAVKIRATYSQRDAFQPGNFTYSNFGPKWTLNWISYITDNPQNASADVKFYKMGGGTRTFNGFDTNTQSFAHEQYDQTKLTRTASDSYTMFFPNGAKAVFAVSDGSVGTSRKTFLTQVIDSQGNGLSLTYDNNLRITKITDTIGQVTALSYTNTSDIYKITRATDPFGRFATFLYDSLGRLTNITDVIGLSSQFTYSGSSDFINALITPYGTTAFAKSENGTTRTLETTYPDGSRDRVEYNQAVPLATSEPATKVPIGMATINQFLQYRNTYYWSRNACAMGYGDHAKAKIYHWLHTPDFSTTAGIIESTKQPLENRVWLDYAGQATAHSVGNTDKPSHVGRVLDDGTTQLYTYAYDQFGHVTNSIDPLGRTLSLLYSTNGIDLLEVRQTRAGNNELLVRISYNSHHRPLTVTGAAGHTTTNFYNARNQPTITQNPKGETTLFTYDPDGYLVSVDGPLPGPTDTATATYDSFGRLDTATDVGGYTLSFDYDDLNRMTRLTHPDSTFEQITYDRLDPVAFQDRAGRQTTREYDSLRRLRKQTDALNRTTLLEWCTCGKPRSLTDALGHTTSWEMDLQGRLTSKQYADGAQVTYQYDKAISRVRQVTDEKFQVPQYSYNRDNTVKSITYANTTVPTPSVFFTYDPNYERVLSMTDGTGTTLYSFGPIAGLPSPGAGQIASVDGPLADDTVSYAYDELGRRVYRGINGVGSAVTYDEVGRPVGATNALGAFSFAYDGSSFRILTNTGPNGWTEEFAYAGNLQDRDLQRITHRAGVAPVSEFIYGHDTQASRVITWSQQVGVQAPDLYTFGYDTMNQLLSAAVTNGGSQVNTFAYSYDSLGNRLTEQVGMSYHISSHNALNQLTTTTGPGTTRTNEWDAQGRLAAVNAGNQRTEFTYDGLSRMVSIRHLTNGVQASLRRFVWCGALICEERDLAGAVTKRFFAQGMKIETGPNAGSYYYTLDHLGSIRELVDTTGTIRARYAYDPYGRRTRLAGNMEADFGFAGMFWSAEVGLALTHFRAYDPELGRWLSRDPLKGAELKAGPNLYAYVGNNPINAVDPEGLIDSITLEIPQLPAILVEDLGLSAATEATLVGVGAVGGAGAAAGGAGGVVAAAGAGGGAAATATGAACAFEAAVTVVEAVPYGASFGAASTATVGLTLAETGSWVAVQVGGRLPIAAGFLGASNDRFSAAWRWFFEAKDLLRAYLNTLSPERLREVNEFLIQRGRTLFDIGILW